VSAEAAARWRALALVATSADLVGIARGAHSVACDYAKIREQYGKQIGSYQAVAHLLAESLALIEGSVSVLRHAAWGSTNFRRTKPFGPPRSPRSTVHAPPEPSVKRPFRCTVESATPGSVWSMSTCAEH